MTEVPAYLRPPPDPYLRKGKPQVNPNVPKSTSAADLLNRGNQLLIELDRQHKRLHEAVEDALKPDPPAWRAVRAAKTDYDAAYAELTSLSKRLNQLVQTENPELVRSPTPPAMTNFGDVVTIKHVRKSRTQAKGYDKQAYDGHGSEGAGGQDHSQKEEVKDEH